MPLDVHAFFPVTLCEVGNITLDQGGDGKSAAEEGERVFLEKGEKRSDDADG